MRVVPLVALGCLASVVSLLASACASSNLTSTAAKECHANADCGSGQSCVYATYDSCGTPGVCVASPDGSACVDQAACGCDGATISVCLVGGNSPTPVTSLGSCDGATTQQGFDATVSTAPDDAGGATGPGPVDTGAPPDDTGAPPPDDSGSTVDAADANTTLLGTTCTSKSQCAAPYDECEYVSNTAPTKTCTTTCFEDQTCQPPPNGACNESTNYCELQ